MCSPTLQVFAWLTPCLASKSPQNTSRFPTRIVVIVWASPPIFKAMKLLNGEGRGSRGAVSAQLSSLVCVFVSAFPMKCVSIVFKSLSDKTLGVCFPQTAKNCSEGSLLKSGVVFKMALISHKWQEVLSCLSWSSEGITQGEKSKFFGSDLNLLTGLQLLRRMPYRKRRCPAYLR